MSPLLYRVPGYMAKHHVLVVTLDPDDGDQIFRLLRDLQVLFRKKLKVSPVDITGYVWEDDNEAQMSLMEPLREPRRITYDLLPPSQADEQVAT